MAEYGSGVFYGRSNSGSSFTQLSILTLPDELDIGPPLLPPKYQMERHVKRDLIILAEFSEVEGPVPILCIPKDHKSDLDLNDLVLQLMSTDFQSLGNSEFHVHQDTCLLQDDPESNVHMWVHYFTLFDVRARGFVRPLCLAYVTRESGKLNQFFHILKARFSKVTEYLRVSNLELFQREVNKRVIDLNFTKDKFIEVQKYLARNAKEPTVDSLPSSEVPQKGKVELPDEESHHDKLHSFIFPSRHDSLLPRVHRKTSLNDSVYQRGETTQLSFSEGRDIMQICRASPEAKFRSYSHQLFSTSFTEVNSLLSSSLPFKLALNSSRSDDFQSFINPSISNRLKLSKSANEEFQLKVPGGGKEPFQTPRRGTSEERLSEESFSSTSTTASAAVESNGFDRLSASNKSMTSDDFNALEHTSLDALAFQILDCHRILEVVGAYLKEQKRIQKDLQSFLMEIRNQPLSCLYNELSESGLLKAANASIEDGDNSNNPSIFVISLLRRSFRNMRSIKELTGIGYIASVYEMMQIHDRFSRSKLTLIFQDLDNELRSVNDDLSSTLFIGNIPIVNLGMNDGENGNGNRANAYYERAGNCRTTWNPNSKRFNDSNPGDVDSSEAAIPSLSNSIWDEDLVDLLRFEIDSKVSTPTSEYQDAFELLNEDLEVSPADDCLRIFTTSEETSTAAAEPSSVDPLNDVGTDVVSTRKKKSDRSIECNEHFRGQRESCRSSASSAKEHGWQDWLGEGEELGTEEEVFVEMAGTSPSCDIEARVNLAESFHLTSVMQQFAGVSRCILEALLTGKTVVVAGPEYLKHVVLIYTKALSSMLPLKHGQTPPVLKWHTGTVVPQHLSMYRIIGVCIPQRLHVQDLMSNSTLNRVTVLNVETGHISGVAYNGDLLTGVERLNRRYFRSNAGVQTAIQDMMVGVGRKVFLFHHLKRTTDRSPEEILKGIGVSKNDWSIILHLSNILNQSNSSLF